MSESKASIERTPNEVPKKSKTEQFLKHLISRLKIRQTEVPLVEKELVKSEPTSLDSTNNSEPIEILTEFPYPPRFEIITNGANKFKACVTLPEKEELQFLNGLGPESTFKYPPDRILSPEQILSQERVHYSDSWGINCEALKHPWVFQDKQGVIFLGTSDHHELYYFLLQQEKKRTNERDILVNFDSHDDISQSKMKPEDNLVTIADFVGMGFTSKIRKVWDRYIWVAPKSAHGRGSKLNFPTKTERLDPGQYEEAFRHAVSEAKNRDSKIILTVDLDFFGSRGILGEEGTFRPEYARHYLEIIFKFIHTNRSSIRLVHFTESLAYAIKENGQIEELYKMLVQLLEN